MAGILLNERGIERGWKMYTDWGWIYPTTAEIQEFSQPVEDVHVQALIEELQGRGMELVKSTVDFTLLEA